MRAAVLTVMAGLVAASANPIVATYISEVSGAEGNEFIELAALPWPGHFRDLRGWTLETSTSCCTLLCSLDCEQLIVIDRAVVAEGILARGTFAVNPDTEHIILTDTQGHQEEVSYPAQVGPSGSLAPGQLTSACRVNFDNFRAQSINWYLDSTPTPGEYNDDYASVFGRIRGSGGELFGYYVVTVSGPNGCVYDDGADTLTYRAAGLNPGTYSVDVEAWIENVRYEGSYPGSVEVPYAEWVTGIDVVIPMTGIRESELSIRPALLGPGVLLDVTGRRVMELGPGENDISQLQPGAFFLRREEDDYTHKVVVQR
ncbi:MAG: hypothetical protein JSU73_02545 [candidate division WOR-3 bacterium]|nr:MAG: hypothetical protein JSU73_02545 [candidate division WOR-3 bacterium]